VTTATLRYARYVLSTFSIVGFGLMLKN